jgi:hypothetical protein
VNRPASDALKAVSWVDALQIAGWLLTVLGQVQVASRRMRC